MVDEEDQMALKVHLQEARIISNTITTSKVNKTRLKCSGASAHYGDHNVRK